MYSFFWKKNDFFNNCIVVFGFWCYPRIRIWNYDEWEYCKAGI